MKILSFFSCQHLVPTIPIDGFGDGIWITSKQAVKEINSTSFGVLQATRTRISKTSIFHVPLVVERFSTYKKQLLKSEIKPII